MPIIEPIPMDELSPVSRAVIESGCEEGLYATPIPLQLFAYSTRHLLSMDNTRRLRGSGSLLGGRILELLRIRSAQLGECQPCMQSRKHDSITDEDVACLLDMSGGGMNDQERLAVKFMDLLSADHRAIETAKCVYVAELAEAVHRRADHRASGSAAPDSMGMHRVYPHARGLRDRRAGHQVLRRPGRLRRRSRRRQLTPALPSSRPGRSTAVEVVRTQLVAPGWAGRTSANDRSAFFQQPFGLAAPERAPPGRSPPLPVAPPAENAPTPPLEPGPHPGLQGRVSSPDESSAWTR